LRILIFTNLYREKQEKILTKARKVSNIYCFNSFAGGFNRNDFVFNFFGINSSKNVNNSGKVKEK